MSHCFLLALAGGLLAGVGSLFLSWRLFQSLGRRSRAVAMGTSAAVVAVMIARAVVAGYDEGTWRCSICCAAREEIRWEGVAIWTGPPREPADARETAARFQEWFQGHFGPCPGHEWTAMGCHSVGLGGVACAMHFDEYYRALPLVDDLGFARSIHERFRVLGPTERRRWLLRWGSELAPLLERLEDDGTPVARAELTERIRDLAGGGE